MKKKFLSIMLAIASVFAVGMFFAGCSDEKGEDQSKLHDKFCLATSSMYDNEQSITYMYERNNKLKEKATYNNTTKEFAYFTYKNNGDILNHEITKLFDNEIAYFSGSYLSASEEKIIDSAYVEKLASDKIFVNYLDVISLDYSGYKAELDAQVAEKKAGLIEDGYTINNASYKIEYKTLAENKYNSKVTFYYEYEDINEHGYGSRHKSEKIISTDFSNDWIFSIKENSVRYLSYYQSGEVSSEETPNTQEVIHSFSKSFDNEFYTTYDLSNKPTQVEPAKLVLVYNPEIIYEFNVDFNVGKTYIENLAKSYRQPGTGTDYEFYLDADYTTPMSTTYQLNTQKDNVIYIETVVAEGYTQITEIYQDSQSVRGTKTRIVKLNEVVEFDKIYDGKTFDGQVYVDGKNISSSIYTFREGDSHTILHLVDYNTDMLTETPIVFTINREYSVYSTGTSSHTIPAGTPSEQTLSTYFYKNLVKVYGLSLSNAALSLEFNTNDNSSCSLNKPLAEITATNCTITITIKPDWIVMEGKSQKIESSTTTLEFELKYETQSLWLKFGNVSERHNGNHWENTNVIKSSTIKEKGEGNFIEYLKLWGFDPGIAYYIYITG